MDNTFIDCTWYAPHRSNEVRAATPHGHWWCWKCKTMGPDTLTTQPTCGHDVERLAPPAKTV